MNKKDALALIASMPLQWQQLAAAVLEMKQNIKTLERRLDRLERDSHPERVDAIATILRAN